MSEADQSAQIVNPPLQLVRLPVDKPQAAVAFLRNRSGGVMDLIAHFWERLAHTPPLLRQDLHLIAAIPETSYNEHINIHKLDSAAFSGAMLYVPKAHRADVLALDPTAAAAFASYISHQGAKIMKNDVSSATPLPAAGSEKGVAGTVSGAASESGGNGASGGVSLTLTDLSAPIRSGTTPEATPMPAGMPAEKTGANGKMPIDFLTGEAEGIAWMTPLLLPLVQRRTVARQLVNVVMQLPDTVPTAQDPHVRLARDADVPTLNRWRRQYKEERGILFDADMDAWVENKRVFVYELPAAPTAEGTSGGDETVVSVAKIDLDLPTLVEIGGVYTFPEHRTRGYGDALVKDMATRIRQAGKVPTLQVDEQNTPALTLYEKAGWRTMGKLARVWLSGT